jgi:opacity protein-like surface antigen
MMRIIALAACLVACGAPVFAQSEGPPPSRFYLRGDIGLALGTWSAETDTDPGSATTSIGFDSINGTLGTGMMFDAGVGWRAFQFLRLEGAVGYIPQLSFEGRFASSPASSARGSVSALVGMASANIDLAGFTGPLPGGIQPFVLGGIGVANVFNSAEDDFFNGAYRNTFSGVSQTNLAWTVGGGIGFPVMPRLTLDLTYRYLDLGQRRVGPLLYTPAGTFTLTQDRADVRVHTIMIGLRYEL